MKLKWPFDKLSSGSLSPEARIVRDALRSLPRRRAPQDLTMKLRILASRERVRQLERRTFATRWQAMRDRWSLSLENLARPLALPAAGGLLSAFILFSMLVAPTYPLRDLRPQGDIPTVLKSGPSLSSTGILDSINNDSDFFIDVVVNEQGRVVDYSFSDNTALAKDPALRRNVGNVLFFTEFNPATEWSGGKCWPVSGKLRISLRRGSIDVKG
ncbi:MAG: hypothetical protein MUC42_01630 [Bryobacter sp.]|jgi:hypothetical protein|nr:hypothetical protein [Bryobacter sp.]